MDRSDDNENSRNNQSLGDDTSSRRLDEEDSVGQKRKRDNLSASLHSQQGGEATMTQNTATHQSDREEGREQQTTSQQRVTEQSKQLNELLVENRELRRKLSERDREIEALRGALEREKQKWLKRDDESQSNDDTAIAMDGTSSTSAASRNSVVAENRTTSNESTAFDESTDEEMVQLSSTSSMDRRHHHRQFNDADDADAEEGGEGKISSVETNVVVTQSQLHENDCNDEGRKEAGGENDEEHTTLPDSGNTTASRSGETNLSPNLRANDDAGENEEEQHAVAENAAAMSRHEDTYSDGQPCLENESTAANPTSKETTKTSIGNDENGSNVVKVRARVGDRLEVGRMYASCDIKPNLKIGSRIAIYWPDDKEYYEGTITTYSTVQKKYYVKYDDGDAAWEDLEKETYKILDGDDEPFGEDGTAAAATVSNAVGLDMSHTEQQQDESDDEVVGGNGTLAFCCQSCTCNNSTTTVKLYSCVHSCDGFFDSMVGNMHLYHKGCCHNEKGDENLFKSPMQISREKGFTIKQKEKRGQECSLQQIKQKHKNAMIEAAKVANEEYLAAEDSKIYACPVYAVHVENFQKRKGTQESPLRVLELFSGIGSGTLALKKLRIPLHTVVHCEHDPIANEVCKFNHQRDGIRHVYIDTFEEIYGESNEADHDKVAKLVADHGPFDLVLAGAPCSNYSGLNANRDASCANAQYLPNVGKLITKLNNIQRSNHGVKHEVLFVSENVVFKDHDDISTCYGGLEPIRLDAKDFSPCKRNRFYWCNIPKYNDEKYTTVASQVSVDCDGILDPDYGTLERLVYDGDDEHLTVKANTFLASLTKIDDDRMLKYSIGDFGRTKIKLEHYTVAERERMMGFREGYVSKPLQVLFNEITTCAILQPETSADGKTYKDFLQKRFWHLRKKLKFQHFPQPEDPYFEIGIATPIENKQKLAFFKEEQYCKHLIGMGFSICVIEALLVPIVDLFATKDMLTTYEGCDYSFPWEPYISYHRDPQMKEAVSQSTNEERQMKEG